MLTPEQLEKFRSAVEIADLAEEVTITPRMLVAILNHIDAQQSCIAELEQRLAAAEQDAARYRWLLNQSWFQEACERYDLDDGGLQYKFDLLIGELIDNAMK